MEPLVIKVNEVEALQMTKDVDGLGRIFTRAKSVIVNGESVVLVRMTEGVDEKFDELSTLEDLEAYKKNVFRYL